jgi:hypothetical protein
MKTLLTILSILATAPAFATDMVLPVSMDKPVMGIPRTATLRDFRTVQTPPEPQSNWSGGIYASICRRDIAAVVMNRFDRWEKPFGLGFDIDFSAFTGPSMKGDVLAGGAATVGFDVTQGVRFSLGIAFDGSIMDLRHIGFGPLFNLAYSRPFNGGGQSENAGARQLLFGPKEVRF